MFTNRRKAFMAGSLAIVALLSFPAAGSVEEASGTLVDSPMYGRAELTTRSGFRWSFFAYRSGPRDSFDGTRVITYKTYPDGRLEIADDAIVTTEAIRYDETEFTFEATLPGSGVWLVKLPMYGGQGPRPDAGFATNGSYTWILAVFPNRNAGTWGCLLSGEGGCGIPATAGGEPAWVIHSSFSVTGEAGPTPSVSGHFEIRSRE